MRRSTRTLSTPLFALLCLAAIGLTGTRAAAAVSLAERRPNIVLIFADDVGYECFGCYGGVSYRTPHLDKLARTGIRFDHCYAQPLCTPSRVKLMTGRYNFRNYTRFAQMDPGLTTFGQVFQDAGYATCLFDKWQLGPEKPDHFGFDEYAVHGPQPTYWGQRVRENGGLKELPEDVYGPDYYTDRLLAFVEQNQDRPFLAYYPTWLGHFPFQPTPASEDPNGADKQKNFADMVAYLDTTIGRTVNRLDELGLREETLILFTADNGTHRSMTSRMQDGRSIQGGKGLMTDTGTHVPLIANWPGTIPPGQVSDAMVDLADFLPTMLDVAGIAPPADANFDGRSFGPQLLDADAPGEPYAFAWFHHYQHDPGEYRAWARDQRWKLYADGRLYDVPADPLEERPIASGEGGPEAERARQELQEALAELLGKSSSTANE